MKKVVRLALIAIAVVLTAGIYTAETSAQVRIGRGRVVYRPVVRPVYRVGTGWRHNGYWRSPYWGYSSFYGPYWQSPYQRYREQKFYLSDKFRDDQNELSKHQREYSADGYISPKEQKELNDNIEDVQESRQKLRSLNRRY